MSYRPKAADEIRRNMSAIRSKDTQAELLLRRELHRLGLRYRLHARELIGRPDVVFRPSRVAVFIDGDFWHARRLRETDLETYRATLRTANQRYWLEKFTRRIARDDLVNRELRDAGWLVLRFWESEVWGGASKMARRIQKAVERRRGRFG